MKCKMGFVKANFKPEFWMESNSWSDKTYFLNEGLIKTYNPEFCIGRIQSEFERQFGIRLINLTQDDPDNSNVRSDKSYIFINYPDNRLSDEWCDGTFSKLELGIYRIGMFLYVEDCEDEVQKQEEFKDALETICGLCGMFISKSEIHERESGGRIFVFIVEPKFSNKDFELNKCGIQKLYHLTKTSRVKKIMDGGLNPKSSNQRFAYPDRIYLGLDPDELERVLLPKFKTGNEGYSILSVNVNCLPKGMKFNIDPNYPDGVFTTGNIPQKAIEVVKNL